MTLAEITPFVRVAVNASLTIDTPFDTFTTLTTPDCRLFLITSGGGEFVINGHSYTASPYDCFLFQSGTEYAWCPNNQTGIGYIAVNFDYTRNFTQYKKSFHPKSISDRQGYQALEKIVFDDAVCLNQPIVIHKAMMIYDRLRTLTVEYKLGGRFHDELNSSILKSVLISIVRQVDEPKSDGRFAIREIIDYIQKNYRLPLTNDGIASIFGYSAAYLSRKFKVYTGMTLHAFVIGYRIDAAAELLRSQDISITRVTELTGFSDIYQFSKCFKQMTGVTPTEYRKYKVF